MLESKHLVFLKAAETGSFTRAAGELFVSPVAVMKQINQLETELGVRLFVRSNQGVSLTAAGAVLRDGIQSIKRDADALVGRVRQTAEEDKTVILVGPP